MQELKEFEKALLKIEEALDNSESGAEDKLYQLEEEVATEIDITHDPQLVTGLKKLFKKIQNTKKDFDFYDEDSLLDYMFPNGPDED